MPIVNLKLERESLGDYNWTAELSGILEDNVYKVEKLIHGEEVKKIDSYQYPVGIRLTRKYTTLVWRVGTGHTPPLSKLHAIFTYLDEMEFRVVASNTSLHPEHATESFVSWTFQTETQ